MSKVKSAKSKQQKPVIEKPKTCALSYKHLSQAEAQELIDCDDVDEFSRKMTVCLKITDTNVDLKNGIILDYFVSGMWWARQQSFDPQKFSGMFTILHVLLENIKHDHLSITDNIFELKKLFTGIGCEEIPEENSGGLEFFTIEDAKNISAYVSKSLFQHYLLFLFLFTHQPAEEILGTDLLVDVAPFPRVPYPPPLAEAISDDDYEVFIKTPEPEKPVEIEKEVIEEVKEVVEKEESLSIEELFARLTPEEVQKIIDEVCQEMLINVETEVASRLRDKENQFISRINSIHRVEE